MPGFCFSDIHQPGSQVVSLDLVGPDLEADQCVRPEGLRDRNIGRIAPLRDQHAADPRHIVAWIEHLPAAADIGLNANLAAGTGNRASGSGWYLDMSGAGRVQGADGAVLCAHD